MEKPDFEDLAEKYSFRVPYDGSNNFYDLEASKHYKAGIEKIWTDYVEPLQKRLEEAEKDRDEFAIGFHRWWESAVMAGDHRNTKKLLSEYKALLNKSSPVIGIGIPDGGNRG